jgi:hypothetical protein
VAEASGPPVEVWPDNVQAVNTFIAMGTQWRVGMAGATGLDYAALPVVMRLSGVLAAERADVFDAVRTMEDAALETMRKANAK